MPSKIPWYINCLNNSYAVILTVKFGCIMNQANIIPYGGKATSYADIQPVMEKACADFQTRDSEMQAFAKEVSTFCHLRQGFAISYKKFAIQVTNFFCMIGVTPKNSIVVAEAYARNES